METAEHIAALDREGRLLVAAAERAGPGAQVTSCPGWRIRDLLRHTGTVHRWATGFVVDGHTHYRPADEEPGLEDRELFARFRDGHTSLVAALRTAPGGLRCWTFLPAPSPLSFWARRQAHETAVHRMDAESALGIEPTGVGAEFAADGVDELLCAFHARSRSGVRTAEPKTLRVRATDTGDVWTVRLSSEPPRTDRTDDGSADCELSGSAERLYTTLWNRRPLSAVALAGDTAVARLWSATSGITWS